MMKKWQTFFLVSLIPRLAFFQAHIVLHQIDGGGGQVGEAEAGKLYGLVNLGIADNNGHVPRNPWEVPDLFSISEAL